MNQSPVLSSFPFFFIYFCCFFVLLLARSRLASTTLRHDIRQCSIALIYVECHVQSSSDDSTEKIENQKNFRPEILIGQFNPVTGSHTVSHLLSTIFYSASHK